MKRIEKQKEKYNIILSEWVDEDWETHQRWGDLYKKMYCSMENRK